MTLPLVIDMNLSPEWVSWFAAHGISAVHWSAVGDPRSDDAFILAWVRERGSVLFTHDLDFGAVLAASGDVAPSVIQLRTPDVTPGVAGDLMLHVLRAFEEQLRRGALVTVEEGGGRARVLPLRTP